jgi:aerotaxis receptor
MRNNQPVSNQRYEIAPGTIIVSRTDDKGRITHGNEDFFTSSGFAPEEIIKEPHNIIRHPDMPSEAFRDLWSTLKSGRPWSGLVKNRRKDGSYYWVRANTNPSNDGGYRSVRVAATNQEIASAETLYRQMQNDSSIILHEGEVYKNGISSNIRFWMQKVTLRQRLIFLGTVILAMLFIFAAFIWLHLSDSRDALFVLQQESAKQDAAVSNIQALVAAEYANSAHRLDVASTAIPLFMLFGGAFIALIISSALSRIKNGFLVAKNAAKSISEGNLTCIIPSEGQDEIGQLVSEISIMRNNLQELVGELRRSIDRLADHSTELIKAANDNAAVSIDQSEAASSIAASVEELSVSIDQVESHAGDAHKLAEHSDTQASDAAIAIEKIATEMKSLAHSVESTANDMRSLEEISNAISGIVKMISEVADQTNLLALNAAIEAARAGEQGRGFAVVADEVRKLAEKTNNSSKEINGMISNVQQAARTAVSSMEVGVSKVNAGATLSKSATESMSAIRSNQSNVTRVVDDIASGLSEQVEATRHIATRIEKISQGAEMLSIKAKQTKESAQNLQNLSGHLNKVILNFRVV